MRVKKTDIILLSVIGILAVLSFFAFRPKELQDKGKVSISVNAKEGKVLDLAEDTVYVYENDKGYTNTISISGGKVRMTDANCPDQLCVHQGVIAKDGEMIVCLPHGLVVEIESSEEAEADIIAK